MLTRRRRPAPGMSPRIARIFEAEPVSWPPLLMTAIVIGSATAIAFW